MKILINQRCGGWGLSERLLTEFYQSLGYVLATYQDKKFLSDDPSDMMGLNSFSQRCSGALVAFVEEWIRIGREKEIHGDYAKIVVVEVDEKRPWFIHNVYGYEVVLYADQPNDFEKIKQEIIGGV